MLLDEVNSEFDDDDQEEEEANDPDKPKLHKKLSFEDLD